MWLLIFIFFLLTFMIAWTLFGYFIMVWFIGLFRPRPVPTWPDDWPLISMIVCSFNEETDILAKLENIRQLDYPKDRLEVIFTDGGSTDKTQSLLKEAIKSDESFRVLCCQKGGKINQLNEALTGARGAIVVNTDVDAHLKPDALRWLAAEFHQDSNVWVAGAYCRPGESLAIEHYFWDQQNKGRFLESTANTSSIVIAPCYAFRRQLMQAFPEDVVADDIYVAFLASTLGHRVVYSRQAMAVETRCPNKYADFLPHKFRKSNAFLRETLRFVHRLPEMHNFCKMMLVTRLLQQIVLPWALLWWVLIAGVLLTLFRFDILIMAVLFLVLLFGTTHFVFLSVHLPDERRRYSLHTTLQGYILTNLIMLATALSYPFYKQGSDYTRLDPRN